MACEGCGETCSRRGGVKLIRRLSELCATDKRYADFLDKKHGVTDEAVVPGAHSVEAPSLLKRAVSVAKAGAKFVGDRMRATSEAVKLERVALCEACDHFDEASRQCNQCGCLIDLKIAMPLEKCPIDKWGVENRPEKAAATTKVTARCRSCG